MKEVQPRGVRQLRLKLERDRIQSGPRNEMNTSGQANEAPQPRLHLGDHILKWRYVADEMKIERFSQMGKDL